jgi:hypothetical protein
MQLNDITHGHLEGCYFLIFLSFSAIQLKKGVRGGKKVQGYAKSGHRRRLKKGRMICRG